jgi:zinc/manganese transport system substrate-binding protein
MKKLLSLLSLLFASVISAAPLKVVATTADLASLAKEVGGEDADVQALASPSQDPHFVEAKPSLVLKIMKADAFVETGLELEVGWAPLLLQQSRNPRVQPGAPGFIDASAAIQPLEVPASPDRSQGDIHPGGNPHYLSDPANAGPVADLLAERFGALRPDKKDAFLSRAADFRRRLDGRMKEWTAKLAAARGAPFVSYHRDMLYFAAAFGLVSAGEIEPKPGIPPSPAHTAALIAAMKDKKARLILTAPWYEDRTPASLARETGARVVVFDPYPGAFPEAADYLSAAGRNVKAVADALEGK